MTNKITIELPEHEYRLMLNNLDYGTEIMINKLEEAAQGSDEVRKAGKTIATVGASLMMRLMNVDGVLSDEDISGMTQRSEDIGIEGMQKALLVLAKAELEAEIDEEESNEAE